MMQRRKFLQLGSLGIASLSFKSSSNTFNKPIILSTWDAGISANNAAWKILSTNGHALDAVEVAAKTIEATTNCCVGLGGYPDRDGFVTLDAAIMDHQYNYGSVACLERIKHPISVARKVMEKTPHTLLVGNGAQKFALQEGFALEPQELSEGSAREYKLWLKKSEYKPIINIENSKIGHGPFAPQYFSNGELNHDTIGIIAMDAQQNLSGACTTSGMGFKMHGRVGDSPIIGAGLYVDNEAGAATATGQGEDIMRICGSHTVVEMMRQGKLPEDACKIAVERIIKIKGIEKAKQMQAGFIAINKQGKYGGYAIREGFSYAVYVGDKNELRKARFVL